MSDHQGRRGRLGGAWLRWPAEAAATWRGRESERLRTPQPLVRRRLPSGRGAIEQPNIATDWEAAHNPRFWAMVALTGVATGLLGDLMMALLFNVQYLAFGYHSGSLQAAIEHAAPLRRVSSLLIAGAFGGVAWYLLRRYTKGEHSEIDDVIWDGDGQLSFRRCLGTSLISEVVIGMGASLGREAAPKLLGGASASALASWAGLSTQQKRLLVACGGGAGLAAVYNVPLGGALFTAEILCGNIALPIMLPALACSGIATLTAWIYLPAHATYLNIPQYRFSGSLMVWALLAGPVLGLISAGYIRLIGWVSHHRATGLKALLAPVLAFGILGVIGIWYPELFGNGKDMANDAFTGVGALGLLLALSALKPLVTVLCLGSGASGGLFTPTLSTGAVLGGALGIAWSLAWPGSPAGAFAMVGAAAMIGAAMQAPITALALVLELTHSGFGLMVPMLAATVTATAVAFYVDGYSIYSARLPSRPPGWRPALPTAQPGAEPAAAPQPTRAGPPGDGASPAAAADDTHHSRAEHPPEPGAPARLAGPEIHREPVHARRHAGIGHWRYLLLIGWSVALLGAGLGSYAPAADADFMFMAAFPGPGHVLGLVLRLAAGARHVDGLPVVIASGIAAAVMLAGALILRGDPGDDGGGWDLTIKAVLLDTAADSAAASGVAASGAIILHARGRGWLDPGAALAITVIISYLAQELVRQTVAAIRSP